MKSRWKNTFCKTVFDVSSFYKYNELSMYQSE